MALIPTLCGKNALHLPSICDEVGRFIGIKDVTLLQGDDFDPTSGVYAVDKNGNRIPYDVRPSNVNTCIVGQQVLVYSTENFVAERTITVTQASAPTISGLSSATVGVGDAFNTMSGVSAKDAHGNTVAVTCLEGNSITYTEKGQHTLHYTAQDACGNVATAQRTVNAVAGSFEGVTNVTINQGISFDPRQGVKAYSYGGEEVSYTVTPSTYAPCQVGDQIFTYTAQGVETATRTVHVNAIANPTISGTSEPITVGKGVEFDPLEGVSAVDGNGNTLIVSVVQGA